MSRYLVKVEHGANIMNELSEVGRVEYISSVLNVFRVFTENSLDDIRKINHVEFVRLEDSIELT